MLFHSVSSSLMSKSTASSLPWKMTSSTDLFRMMSPLLVANSLRSAKSTRFKAYRNIFDFSSLLRNSELAVKLPIGGKSSHISSRMSLRTCRSILSWPAGMKKKHRNLTFSAWEATLLMNMA